MSSQNIPLKARTDLRDPTEFWPRRPFAFELRRRGYAAQAQCKHPAASSRRRWSSICIVEMTRELRRFLPIQRCSAGGKTSNTIASMRWTFVAKRASQIILLKSRTGFRNQPNFGSLLCMARMEFRTSQPSGRALGNLVRNSNWLLGSRFSRSRCWCWLGYHYRIGNRLRNVDGFRAGLMATNHARSP
jgi:hypothetical protein